MDFILIQILNPVHAVIFLCSSLNNMQHSQETKLLLSICHDWTKFFVSSILSQIPIPKLQSIKNRVNVC